MALTVRDLQTRLARLPGNADIYVYVGPEGVRVQAEWPTSFGDPRGMAVVFRSTAAVPQAGGEAE